MTSAIEYFSERSDKEWSLTDCISFLVMQRLDLREALTADEHFHQAGFEALLREKQT
jgi:predicted nucleic acid-binding protein